MKRAWPALWIALGVALVIRTGLRDRGVITDHLEFGRRVLEGLDPYAPFDGKPLHPPYPPGFGLLAAPFSLLPERLARFAWGIVQVLALWAIGSWLARTLERYAPALRRRLHLVLAVTAVVVSRYVLRDTHGGGGNLINLALALSSLTLAERGAQRSAGWVLGFSLATKPTHVLLVPLLWWFGRRRAAATSVLAAAAFTCVSLLLIGQGFAPLMRWLDGTWSYATMTDVFAEPELGFPPFTWMNQCLRCAVARYTGEVPAEYAELVPGFFPGLGLAPEVTSWIARVLGAALIAATAAVAAVRREDRAWLVAAVLALSLLLSPISWKAHHVALIPGFFLLAVRGFAGARWVWWFLAAYWALCAMGEEITGKGFKEVQQSLYLVTAGTAAIWGLCLKMCMDKRYG